MLQHEGNVVGLFHGHVLWQHDLQLHLHIDALLTDP